MAFQKIKNRIKTKISENPQISVNKSRRDQDFEKNSKNVNFLENGLLIFSNFQPCFFRSENKRIGQERGNLGN